MTPDRFHVQCAGRDAGALRAALASCLELARAQACAAIGLAVHGKRDLDEVVRSVLGESLVRALDRDNRLELKGITTQLLTEKIRVRRLDGPVLAAFVSPDKLDQIAVCAGVTAVVYVPASGESLPAYLAKYPSSREIDRLA